MFASFPFFTHLIGYHCDSNKNVRQTSFFDIATNFELAQLDKDDYYNYSEYRPTGVGTNALFFKDNECVLEIKYSHTGLMGEIYTLCNQTDTGCFLMFKTAKKFLSSQLKCVICDNASYYNIKNPMQGDTEYVGWGCNVDTYPNNKTGCDEVCDIPPYYYWESSTGNFVCIKDDKCGDAIVGLGYSVDVVLDKQNAKRVYASVDSDKDYKGFIKLKCDNDLQPNIAVGGVPIFSYKLWILLYVVAVLFFFLRDITPH